MLAGRGAAPGGRRGIAPGIKLMSYRVFPNAGGGASSTTSSAPSTAAWRMAATCST
ncbi:hypothetical protein [Massilia sp. MB5]|uniref:hypothetical protein n=1 Tax=Massilia sp. MB5 TaxID=2919578 RepID=UPI0035A29030